MNDKTKIALIYVTAAVVAVIVVSLSIFARKGVDRSAQPTIVTPESTEARVYTKLEKPIEFLDQEGREVTLETLKGKVWVFVQFYASCPQCAQRNYMDLKKLHAQFKDHADFRLVCITVNPASDDVQQMKDYAEALSAPADSWLFLTGDPEKIMPYMVEEFKYPTVKKVTDEKVAAEKGEYAHDLSFAVFDRDLQMRGKFDLFSNRDANPKVYGMMKAKMESLINQYLAE